MSDPDPEMSKDILQRVRGAGEETVGKMAKDVLSSPIVTGAARRAMEVRERATQAQEVAMGAFNVPSAADIERLTRRVRNVSQRLESIEDAVERLDDRLSDLGDDARLRDIAAQLDRIEKRLAGNDPA
ncbi:MAG: hypothetical protein AB7G37_12365 [Solirubrobacteraceae bacterium]